MLEGHSKAHRGMDVTLVSTGGKTHFFLLPSSHFLGSSCEGKSYILTTTKQFQTAWLPSHIESVYIFISYTLIFQFPIFICNQAPQLPIYQETIDPWFQILIIYRELEDKGNMDSFGNNVSIIPIPSLKLAFSPLNIGRLTPQKETSSYSNHPSFRWYCWWKKSQTTTWDGVKTL